MQVRRLTPAECEALQGFPRDYTLIPIGKKMAADGPRYKALGNSWAVPNARWIGERLQAVADIPKTNSKQPASAREGACHCAAPGGHWPAGHYSHT